MIRNRRQSIKNYQAKQKFNAESKLMSIQKGPSTIQGYTWPPVKPRTTRRRGSGGNLMKTIRNHYR